MTRIKIDMVQGIVEAEGEEAFVRVIYQDFREALSKKVQPDTEQTKPDARKEGSPHLPSAKDADSKKKSVKKPRTGPKMVPDLDLSGGGKTESLRAFYAKYNAKTNYDRNLIFIYYLKSILNVDAVTIDHVFTCYRNIQGVKIPGSLEQSLIDTRSRKGWIDTASLDNIGLNVHGINHLEHDMEKAEAGVNAG